MLQLFKSNNPGVVVFYLLYLVVLRVCLWFVPIEPMSVAGHHEPLTLLVFGSLNSLGKAYPLVSTLLAATLTFIQALVINGIVNGNKITTRKNYVGGLLYLLVASWLPQQLFLTPAGISLTFIILLTSRIFSLIRNEKAYGDIFDVGFLAALAALFYFPAIVFILFGYIGLSTVRSFVYREWIIVLLGFVSPLFLTFTYYYFTDTPMPQLFSGGWLQGLDLSTFTVLCVGILTVLTMALLLVLPAVLYSTLIQVRKFSTLLIFSVFVIAGAFFLQWTASWTHLVYLALPVSVLGTMLVMQIKNETVSEVIHLMLILLLLAGQYVPLLHLI
ncbi:MAG: hypothetical protein U0T75_14845 [Chitinophagales bacterium]